MLPFTISLISVFFFLFLFFQSAHSYSFTGYQIRDLTSTDEPSFLQEVTAWNLSVYQDTVNFTKHSNCAGTFLLGGYGILGSTSAGPQNQYFQRVYRDLPAHNMIKISFSLWMLDGWTGTDNFVYLIDRSTWKPDFNLTLSSSSFLCGTSDPDIADYKVYGQMPHNSSVMILSFYNLLLIQPSTVRSFGIRDINILFYHYEDVNLICSKSYSKDASSICQCRNGGFDDYLDCPSCSIGCKGCFNYAYSGCYLCESGWYFDGKICAGKCHSTCSVCSGPNPGDCGECKPEYVLFDGSCMPPCATITDYLYKNGSCSPNCSAPYLAKTEGNINFCREGPAATVSDIKPTPIDIVENNQSPTGIIIGICLGVAIVLLAIAVYVFIKRKKALKRQNKRLYIQKESPSSQRPSFSQGHQNSPSQIRANYAPQFHMRSREEGPNGLPIIVNEIIESPASTKQMMRGVFEEENLFDSRYARTRGNEREPTQELLTISNLLRIAGEGHDSKFHIP